MARVVLPEEIVAEALEWEGTRFKHQGCLKRVSADCAGLVLGVGIHTGAFDANPYTPDMRRRFGSYGRRPNPRLMRDAMDILMTRLPDLNAAGPGDVVYLEFEQDTNVVTPQHLAIITEGGWQVGGKMMHAVERPFRSVRQHGINDVWHRRIHRAYRYPAVQRAVDEIGHE